MAKRMLIDASHPEETRVVVVDGNRLEDFDFETSTRKQLKGNIYLAKLTRVEPSLQAVFVDYGGNRHGFLAFSEIHPDYYQVPVADRQALEQEAEAAAKSTSPDEEAAAASGEGVEVVSGDEIDDTERRRQILNRMQALRKYKVQEVIKKRQILLVQVVKEERGSKGAALTTYISLAGRYCVLMPNTPRGGGISRKIVKSEDRKRLKAIMSKLAIDPRMGLIVRTAGMERTKGEIKRDFDYLTRLWDDICEKTLRSTAPTLINEEANLIKRSIRDLYTRDVDEILVEGEEGYRVAKEFIRMMIPSHASRVKHYRDRIPLFQRYQVESQLDSLHSPTVPLKSGGYIVINATEALVAIDVNSGRATKERNIEETATKTNVEAAVEIARELRLRDLAGLIVIDFIDMNEPRNHRQVEQRLKEAAKSDRARIQMGKISPFGLLELSRQRLRPSLLEVNTETCVACKGTGVVRSTGSSALQVLRAIEEEGLRGQATELEVGVPTPVAFYILNQKRAALDAIEERYGFQVAVINDDTLVPPDYRIERIKAVEPAGKEAAAAPQAVEGEAAETKPKKRRRRKAAAIAEAEAARAEEVTPPAEERAEEARKTEEEAPRKRRRRGKRGGRRRSGAAKSRIAAAAEAAEKAPAPEAESAEIIPLAARAELSTVEMGTERRTEADGGPLDEATPSSEAAPHATAASASAPETEVAKEAVRDDPSSAQAVGEGSEAAEALTQKPKRRGRMVAQGGKDEGAVRRRGRRKRTRKKAVAEKPSGTGASKSSGDGEPEKVPAPRETAAGPAEGDEELAPERSEWHHIAPPR